MKQHKFFSCRKKQDYPSRKTAKLHLLKLKSAMKIEYEKDSLVIYECCFCDFYHIGKHPTIVKRGKQLLQIKEGISRIMEKLSKEERKILGQYIGYLIYKSKE